MGIETALIGGGAILGSSLLGAAASNKAANAQADAAGQSAALQKAMFDKQVELQAPWREAGISALNKLTPLATNYTPFGMDQFQADPGYQFRLSEGMKALDRAAAARGGLISGSALKAAQRYGQDAASNEYQNAFNRYQSERTAQLNPLLSLAGLGQTSANTLSNAAGNYATNAGNALTDVARASAAGTMGMANAVGSGVSQYLNYNRDNNLINALRGGSGIGGAGWSTNPVAYSDASAMWGGQ